MRINVCRSIDPCGKSCLALIQYLTISSMSEDLEGWLYLLRSEALPPAMSLTQRRNHHDMTQDQAKLILGILDP